MANVLIKEEVLLIDEPIDFAHPLDPNAVDGWWWIEPDVASELLELLTVQDVHKQAPHEVAESCFLQLYAEAVRSMVPFILFTPPHCKAPEDAWAPSDDLTAKLEAFGYDVGYRFVERFSRDRPRLLEPLDVIKFLCKDFWIHIFKKQIDKLQTNHRSKQKALVFLVFPCGLLRGALANLGILAIVNADLNAVPGCVFNIKLR
ncbi:hypothetical protein B5M09_009845 [Aphanomyces astaci]|uniref:Trafficking protein particle complex subunit 6B n=1 Tax=Aphanomyces astaci TaxID=112090 RepID=A0A3R7WBD7_APHAT|nr:hypothetical protein B5M09_009845 [Aphanomyces astaci]